ncbi:DUF5696 domain-containing protein [Caldicellulosiruptoraceae bacterium PP1]
MKKASFILVLIYLLSCFIVQTGYSQLDNRLAGYKKVAESQYLELFYNSQDIAIAVKDKRNNSIWFSSADKEYLLKNGVEEFFVKNFKSMWILTYTNLAGEESTTKQYNSTKSDISVSENKINNGIKLTFTCNSIRIRFAIEFSIDKDKFIVKVPANSIAEQIDIQIEINNTISNTRKNIVKLENLLKNIRSSSLRKVADKKRIDIIATDIDNIKSTLNSVNGVDNLNNKAKSLFSYAFDINEEIQGSEQKGRGLLDIAQKSNKVDKKTIESLKEISQISTEIANSTDNYRMQEFAGIVKIDILPYFGSSGDNEKGYMLIPDGSGGLSYFKNKHPQYLSYYSKEIYMDTLFDINRYENDIKNGMQEILMPVIGVKKENAAFIAYLNKGEANASVNYMPSGYEVNLNRIFFSFNYRRLYESVTKNWNGQNYKIYDRTPTKSDKEITYMFLPPSQADYSGMANKLREYLVSNKLLKKSRILKDNISLGLDIFLGIKEERILIDKFIASTTYMQAKDIVDYLMKNGVNNINLNLIGWMKGGYGIYPSSFEAERKLGGNKEFDELIKFTKQKNIPTFLQVNMIDASSKVGGFSVRNDVVRAKNGKQITNASHTRFIFSPQYVFEKYSTQIFNFISRHDYLGVNFEKLGWFIYPDYKDKAISRDQTEEYWEKTLDRFVKNNILTASMKGNIYVAKYVDLITSLPYKSTGFAFIDEDVPFYQMVIHGYIPYSMKPFNLFYDKKLEKLKALEYGAIPYYQVTYKDSSELKYTDYKELFTSKFDQWKNDILATYKEFKNRVGSTSNKYIISHKKINSDIVAITYSNNLTVYINYSNKKVKINKIIINPLDYIVVK